MRVLDYAICEGYEDVCRLLLERGAILGGNLDPSEIPPKIQALLREHEARRATPPTREERKLARRLCDVCGKRGPVEELCFPVCDNCSSRRYCGLDCQREDWIQRGHREQCAALSRGESPEPAPDAATRNSPDEVPGNV